VYPIQHSLCDKVCHRLAAGQLFSPGIQVSPTNKTEHQRNDSEAGNDKPETRNKNPLLDSEAEDHEKQTQTNKKVRNSRRIDRLFMGYL
jgi:hypothetical protein